MKLKNLRNGTLNRILITGANRGIGLELCKQLVARGEEVIAACRASNSQLGAMSLRVIEGVDVGSAESILDFQKQPGLDGLDWVINNAGILSVESLATLDFENIEKQFRINALGPLRVTSALLPKLGPGSKIGIITSRMGSVGDNTSGGYYGYRMSKAAVNMAGMCLARDLQERGIAVALLHPGMVATEMTGGRGVSPEQSARGLIQRMDALDISHTGSFWHAEGEQLPW